MFLGDGVTSMGLMAFILFIEINVKLLLLNIKLIMSSNKPEIWWRGRPDCKILAWETLTFPSPESDPGYSS